MFLVFKDLCPVSTKYISLFQSELKMFFFQLRQELLVFINVSNTYPEADGAARIGKFANQKKSLDNLRKPTESYIWLNPMKQKSWLSARSLVLTMSSNLSTANQRLCPYCKTMLGYEEPRGKLRLKKKFCSTPSPPSSLSSEGLLVFSLGFRS